MMTKGVCEVKKVMIAVDGSQMADKVLLRGRMVAEQFGCDVIVMTVVKKMQMINYYTGTDLSDRLNKEFETSAEKTMEQAKKLFEGFLGDFQTSITEGDPAEEILQATENEKPDLLVMGSRGLSGFGRVMLGSVSLKVLHHVTCDMLIVRNEAV